MPLIEVVDVSKHYGKFVAVDHLNLSIPEGGCFGLLGPNGAGKTTLIEMIENISTPTSGQVLYQGEERTAGFRESIGIMFQETALFDHSTVMETLSTFKSLYRKSYDMDELIDLCSLDDIRNSHSDKISGGQRQRLLFALAMINKPKLILLDEPTTGLDPQARRNLWDIINSVKAQGKTIILTTHYMEEAQYLCDQIAIMDRGKVVAQASPDNLIGEFGGGATITLPEGKPVTSISKMPFKMKSNGEKIEIPLENMNQAIQHLLEDGMDLTRVRIDTPNLETVFLNLTGRRMRE